MPTRKVIYPVSMNTYLIFDSIPTLDIGVAQHRAVTEVAPKSPCLCVNGSPIRYCFVPASKSIR